LWDTYETQQALWDTLSQNVGDKRLAADVESEGRAGGLGVRIDTTFLRRCIASLEQAATGIERHEDADDAIDAGNDE